VLVSGLVDMQGYGRGRLSASSTSTPAPNRAVLTGMDGDRALYVLRGVTTLVKESLPTTDLFGTGGPVVPRRTAESVRDVRSRARRQAPGETERGRRGRCPGSSRDGSGSWSR
jgi:hypothetical protein